ncbi:MAG: hypothetical protein AAF721_15595 [Myxococcota bacterium]
MIRSARATSEVTKITPVSEEEVATAKRGDPRFVRPSQRSRIKEDSGTYSVVYKRS